MGIEEYLIRNFIIHNPNFRRQIDSYEIIGPTEVVITFDNGERIIYDDMDKAIEYMREDFDDRVWRMRFGRRLNRKMQFAGLDRKMLSERSGVSLVSISKYITGKSVPSLYNAERLANAIGCSIEELIRFPR